MKKNRNNLKKIWLPIRIYKDFYKGLYNQTKLGWSRVGMQEFLGETFEDLWEECVALNSVNNITEKEMASVYIVVNKNSYRDMQRDIDPTYSKKDKPKPFPLEDSEVAEILNNC